MATYKEIFGKQIKFLSSDPANEATGQIWYNSTSGTFKTVLSGGAWSSSTPLITATVAGATLGTQTAALITSGYGYPSAPAGIPQTQIYDGSGWSAGGALTDPRTYFAGAGTTAAGLVFGGTDTSPPYRTGVTEEYNGTAWSEESDLGTARYMLVATGTQTAAMCITGNSSPPAPLSFSTAVEDYNGASWTAGTATSIGKQHAMGCGTSTASVAFGGNINPYVIVGTTEDWNGTAWSAGGAMNTARRAGGGVGIQTAALCFGGAGLPSPSPTYTNVTENYDGSTWTTNSATLATAFADQDGMGTNTAALLAGGNPGTPPHNLETEEYNVGTTVITAAAWAAGGTYPTNASGAAVAGTQDAAIAFGGTVYPGPNGPTNISATYDGSSWTLTPVINTSRSNSASAKNGSQTAALMIAGNAPGISNACEEYNGASWSTVNTYPLSARIHDQGTGTQIAALCSAGYGGGPGSAYLTTTCTYDGTNWTALAAPSDMNAGRFSGTTVGTQTAAVMFGGTSPGGSGLVESWDGSTWSEEAATFNVPRNAGGSAGTSTDAIFFGGEPAGNGASTEHWNGTSFSTRPNLATSHYAMGSTGTATAGLSVGGAGGAVNETEEYSGSTTALSYKTITTS